MASDFEDQPDYHFVLCTNRLTSIDPAVLRRAAEIFEFRRPNEVQRRAVVEQPPLPLQAAPAPKAPGGKSTVCAGQGRAEMAAASRLANPSI